MSANMADIVERLKTRRGGEFEEAVVEACKYFGFSATLTASAQAESDVIAEADLAESPYFMVIECCAVDDHNQVGYEKLGQLRGNFPSYMDGRRQRIFKAAYKVVVGRPRFSADAVNRADPDIGLIAISDLVSLIDFHSRYRLSQDELETIFKSVGEIRSEHIRGAISSYQRRVAIYALVCLALLEEPHSTQNNRPKSFAPSVQIAGEVKAYGNILGVEDLGASEVSDCIRDLNNPFMKVITSRNGAIRLSSLDLNSVATSGGRLGSELLSKLNEFRSRLEKIKSDGT